MVCTYPSSSFHGVFQPRNRISGLLTCEGNYGIVTSVITKAWPRARVTSSGSVMFSTLPPQGSNTSISVDTFWEGVKQYFGFTPNITDAGGLG